MKLYICWALFEIPGKPGHPCTYAHDKLVENGHDPEVIKSYGWKFLPKPFNLSKGRRLARKLTGKNEVPLLLFDDGSWVQGSKQIAAWARANLEDTAQP